jgi:hypothetical protein
MLHMFAMVFKCFLAVFSQVFQTFVSSVSSVFFCMLQLLYLDVSKVDRMLRMGFAWEATGGAGDVQGDVSPLLVRSLAPCAGTVQTLALGSDIQMVASPLE